MIISVINDQLCLKEYTDLAKDNYSSFIGITTKLQRKVINQILSFSK